MCAMVCAACGEALPAEAVFCGFCGFRVGPLNLPDPEFELEPGQAHGAGRSGPDRPVIRVDAKPDIGLDTTVRIPLSEPDRPGSAPDPDSRPDSRPTSRPTSPTGANRACRRFPMRVDVHLSSAHNFYTGAAAENISLGGLFVAISRVEPVGQLLEVTFTVPGLAQPCTVPCEVRWHRRHGETPGAEPGMGLRFLRIDARARAAIEAFIAHREPVVRGDSNDPG